MFHKILNHENSKKHEKIFQGKMRQNIMLQRLNYDNKNIEVFSFCMFGKIINTSQRENVLGLL